MKTINIKNAKKLLLLALIGTVGLTGCNKFLDVNENPNNPETATPGLLLPTVEAAISQVVGNSFQVYGNIWGQYWTQNPTSSQYRTLDQYRITNSAMDRPWSILYRNALNNAELIINSNVAANDNYKGIAYILKAYAFQVATDAYGDIPLSEGLKADGNLNPKYEAQQVVYDSIFSNIDKGLALIATEQAIPVSSQDMIFSGDLNKWKAFANTLKLRAYLRISNVDASKAAAGIKALYANKATFLEDDATITYTTTGGNENPFYNEMVGLGKTQNVVASATAVKAFVRNNDPRRFAFYDKVTGQDTIAHINQGTYATNTNKLVSSPSPLVGGRAVDPTSAVAPVKLISATESLFLQAEAVVRGWGSGDAKALYEAGITSSFTTTGNATAAANYIATAPDAVFTGSVEAKIKSIITQKYFAMCGFQGFESWTEWRRTGYPTFFTTSAASTLGEGRMPLRMPYANSEATTNVNYPGNVVIYTPVWWDVK
ncbi:SusD/RagB family nutrient-binding outer membrane lipoprotein [Sphingobacterium sp. N143]|uniref:SusD/RagB family nutrient-binding outer membrane lipoprotein n=1 Tax=Sphingobacterium sp. N143 TaxID=2746727 RepID=UPI002576591F|nr:SusD/RagB family nutrient-binding outer membrane lipoprotein [Sphingobacterium sp. N143]MDM1294478.1 SusD/RagB family nutrient-binding outer membrane lipoprotein [Sphingobacterium sp. N143]